MNAKIAKKVRREARKSLHRQLAQRAEFSRAKAEWWAGLSWWQRLQLIVRNRFQNLGRRTV